MSSCMWEGTVGVTDPAGPRRPRCVILVCHNHTLMSNVQGCTITGVAGGSDFCVLAAANCLLAEPVVHAIANAPILFALA